MLSKSGAWSVYIFYWPFTEKWLSIFYSKLHQREIARDYIYEMKLKWLWLFGIGHRGRQDNEKAICKQFFDLITCFFLVI